MLDLGANVDCTAEHLLQFGIMGAMLVAAVEHKERPTVGLLNIGVEDIKGNEAVKQAAELLRDSGLNFYGNVEGDDIYKGTIDVVVCDGFVGNVALKASEGVAQMMADHHARGILAQPADASSRRLVAMPVLKAPCATAWTTAATTARACSACAASSSRATARPTCSPSARRSSARWTRCATTCRSASPRAWQLQLQRRRSSRSSRCQ